MMGYTLPRDYVDKLTNKQLVTLLHHAVAVYSLAQDWDDVYEEINSDKPEGFPEEFVQSFIDRYADIIRAIYKKTVDYRELLVDLEAAKVTFSRD